MGLGYYLTEEVKYDDAGRLLTIGTWEYKPPCSHDIPVKFSVDLLKNQYNKAGVLGAWVLRIMFMIRMWEFVCIVRVCALMQPAN